MAQHEIYWHFWLLPAHDVLHHGWRLDDVLLLQESAG